MRSPAPTTLPGKIAFFIMLTIWAGSYLLWVSCEPSIASFEKFKKRVGLYLWNLGGFLSWE